MVQNKLDLLNEKDKAKDSEGEEFSKSDVAKKFAKENNFLTNIQVSAKENINLEKVFQKLVKSIQKRKLINYDTASNFGDEANFSRSKSSILELQKDIKKLKKEGNSNDGGCYC